MSLIGSGVIATVEERINIFKIAVYISVKYALIYGWIDTAVFKGSSVAVEFDSVVILVAIDLILIRVSYLRLLYFPVREGTYRCFCLPNRELVRDLRCR